MESPPYRRKKRLEHQPIKQKPLKPSSGRDAIQGTPNKRKAGDTQPTPPTILKPISTLQSINPEAKRTISKTTGISDRI